MAKYKLKPMYLSAFSFDEVMEYGKTQTTNIYNNLPWSFDFYDHHVSHETDSEYRIANNRGADFVFTPNQMLMVENNNLIPIDIDHFKQMCDPVEG